MLISMFDIRYFLDVVGFRHVEQGGCGLILVDLCYLMKSDSVYIKSY